MQFFPMEETSFICQICYWWGIYTLISYYFLPHIVGLSIISRYCTIIFSNILSICDPPLLSSLEFLRQKNAIEYQIRRYEVLTQQHMIKIKESKELKKCSVVSSKLYRHKNIHTNKMQDAITTGELVRRNRYIRQIQANIKHHGKAYNEKHTKDSIESRTHTNTMEQSNIYNHVLNKKNTYADNQEKQMITSVKSPSTKVSITQSKNDIAIQSKESQSTTFNSLSEQTNIYKNSNENCTKVSQRSGFQFQTNFEKPMERSNAIQDTFVTPSLQRYINTKEIQQNFLSPQDDIIDSINLLNKMSEQENIGPATYNVMQQAKERRQFHIPKVIRTVGIISTKSTNDTSTKDANESYDSDSSPNMLCKKTKRPNEDNGDDSTLSIVHIKQKRRIC